MLRQKNIGYLKRGIRYFSLQIPEKKETVQITVST